MLCKSFLLLSRCADIFSAFFIRFDNSFPAFSYGAKPDFNGFEFSRTPAINDENFHIGSVDLPKDLNNWDGKIVYHNSEGDIELIFTREKIQYLINGKMVKTKSLEKQDVLVKKNGNKLEIYVKGYIHANDLTDKARKNSVIDVSPAAVKRVREFIELGDKIYERFKEMSHLEFYR